jgi:transcriptional regulator of acetoin/glycerol metabolism
MPLQTRLVRVLEDRAINPLGANSPRPVDFRAVAVSKVSANSRAAICFGGITTFV